MKNKLLLCILTNIFLVVLNSFSNQLLADDLLGVYVWKFNAPDDWSLADVERFRDDFRRNLVKKGSESNSFTVTERPDIDKLLSQRDMEIKIREMNDVPMGDIETLKTRGARSVVFGKIDNDVKGGEINISVIWQLFDSTVLAYEAVQMLPNQRYTGSIRREKMHELSEKISNLFLSNLNLIANQDTTQSDKQIKCVRILDTIDEKKKEYDYLSSIEDGSNKLEINKKIIPLLDVIIVNYRLLETCPGQITDDRKKHKLVIQKYSDELTNRKLAQLNIPLLKKYERLALSLKDTYKNSSRRITIKKIIRNLNKVKENYSLHHDKFHGFIENLDRVIFKYEDELSELTTP
ncbi:MAG: hypothetical protein Q3M24_01720 [Candidatus Electrothrix aestuarii]|uniref:Uncharacterized protein n=1 Tax=Candidatus Electrothrix aestuarii TaxID=3062594 RepID=A0AAU8LWV2_9BACT|nr:hypothetical protein [Candidatus Electrothrix aestuarii]